MAELNLQQVGRVEEAVQVPNTEFVALIVGRNGHKIKAIRERTETFIKTPLRNEPPVFKIAGSASNVARAKNEILEIVQRLKNPQYRMGSLLSGSGGDDSLEKRITSSVRVPFKFVGLVVGFQGSTIMDIQNKTKTHIQTPPHGGEPIFQITGEPKNVFYAKVLILLYIEERTGLRVLEMESLVDENIDPSIMKLLGQKGVADTWSLLMSHLEGENNQLDNTMARLNINDLNGISCRMPPAARPITPPPEDFFDYDTLCNQFHATEDQSHATTTPFDLHAIAGQTINTLFPETPQPEQGYPSPNWPQESPYNPPQPSPPVLDASFWQYVASVNNLPPEQVL